MHTRSLILDSFYIPLNESYSMSWTHRKLSNSNIYIYFSACFVTNDHGER